MSELGGFNPIIIAPPVTPPFVMAPPDAASVIVVPVVGQGVANVDTFLHTQETPTSVWPDVVHNLNRTLVEVTVYSLDYSIHWDGVVVQPIDANTVRISFDDPTAGIALIS